MKYLVWLASLSQCVAVTPPCDTSLDPSKACDDFCNYRCGLYNASEDSGAPQNITIYRITPPNTTGTINKNTGDPRGDVGFVQMRRQEIKACAKNPDLRDCIDLLNNIYGKFVVEVDGQYGPYAKCNPLQVGGSDPWTDPEYKDTRDWVCGQNCWTPTPKGCGGHSGPVVPPPKNGTDRHGGLNCYCDTTGRHNLTVGRMSRPQSSGHSGYTSFGGHWYSTLKAGMCPTGAALGTNGCTWREISSLYKNATCVNTKVDASVEKYGKNCFSGCSQPLNRTSDCYLGCYERAVGKMPAQDVVGPWLKAFEKEDPSEGGCAIITPLPCKGEMCDPVGGQHEFVFTV
jgi:hypothetical protein